ncbi:hypothetical protein [Desulfovibrio piger]|uniref:hypothetical protein n=1 Tax=Desulfovibrio piger TaxID=901 RepID=UPI002941D68E|nr:hypothetical protein [Desulfovibrio piger]
MIKKVFTVLLGLLVAGTMISVDCSDAAVKRNRVRPRTVSKPVTQPAPTATQQTTAAPAAAATTTAPRTATSPAATATQPTTAQGMPYGQTAAPGQTMAAPQSQGSGMGSALLGVGAGLAGGYLLNSALSGSDATAAEAAAAAAPAAGASAPAAAAPASPVANLLGYDTANYCTQLSQGNADIMQQCTAAETAATAAFRQCVAMSSGLNGIGSYDALLRCLRGTPAAQ